MTASGKLPKKKVILLYSIQIIKIILEDSELFPPSRPHRHMHTDIHPHLSAGALLETALTMGAGQIKLSQTSGGKGMKRGGGGGREAVSLMKFLEEVPRPLQCRTHNHSVRESDREEDRRIKSKKGRQKSE